jgi:hypothetical protein
LSKEPFMSRPRSSTIGIHLSITTLIIACFTCLVLAPSAHAGIGNPIKKAKEKIQKSTQKAVEEPAEPEESGDTEVVFDDATVELTEARITGILDGYEKAREAGAGRPALVEKRNKLADERDRLDEKEGEKVRELQRKRDDVETCYHDGYQAARDRKGEEYKNRALTDPALREKFMRAAQENNEAAARGDSAAIARINAVFYAETLPSAEDSAAVRKSCGPLPPHSAAEDKLDALDKQIGSLDGQVRDIDDKISQAQAKQGGLTPEQWGVALERIRSYLGWRQGHTPGPKSSPRGYSDDELKAMEGHLQQLKSNVW